MKIKHCPFCGGKAELVKGIKKNDGYRVYCPSCWVSQNYTGASKEKAIEVWNTRAFEDEGLVAIRTFTEQLDDLAAEYRAML